MAQLVTLMMASRGSSISGIGDGVAADVFLAVPNQRLHLYSPASGTRHPSRTSKSNSERWLLSHGAKIFASHPNEMLAKQHRKMAEPGKAKS